MPPKLQMVNSDENFKKHKLIEHITHLESEIVCLKSLMCEMNSMLTELIQITPHRHSGWFGDYKTYPHQKK